MGERRPEPVAVDRAGVFEEDGLQPVSRACRDAVRRAAAALADGGVEIAEAALPRPGSCARRTTRSSATSS
jgi:Asp-tRNA(Asn)/Glu-tRNA(Gln) amidotransferase A subunit family amidase